MNGDGLIGVPGEYECGSFEGSAVVPDLDNVIVTDSKVRCGRRTQYCRVIPDELRDRFGQLLKPGVVRPAAVSDARIGPEVELDRRSRLASLQRGYGTNRRCGQ